MPLTKGMMIKMKELVMEATNYFKCGGATHKGEVTNSN